MELSTSPRVDASTWTTPHAKLDGLSLLDLLFNRMDGMYPGKWKANFPSAESIKNWKDECARVFGEDGITPAHVAVGIKVCRRLYTDWPPSVPQFANACMPPVDPVAAYYEALAGIEARNRGEIGMWSHPAVYWAASRLSRDLMLLPSAQIRDRWAATLKAQLSLGAWEEIPGPRPQLAAPGEAMLSKEGAAKMLAEIGASGILRKPANFDHLRWAKVILEREAAGDPKLTISLIRSAKEALGIARVSDAEVEP